MIKLNELNIFLREVLGTDQPEKDPIMPDGLQVKGKKNIEKIGFAVSASLELFKEAKKYEIDCLIVHHGLHLPNRYVDLITYRRLKYLMKHEISLFGFHYLLDSNPDIGNNAVILKELGLNLLEPYIDNDWGFVGEFNDKKNRKEVIEKCEIVFKRKGIRYLYGPQTIKKVVSISGGYAPSLTNMQALKDNKIDLFIGGESREHLREYFREAEINFIGAGHYNTETFGVKALLKKVKEEFGSCVKCFYMDLFNEV
jgi:dinuclear metal center YbgI/SA1388 family protein